ncbi:MAG: hypothetical protein HKN92_04360, partial [Chitinophagales bacterium]|nr:hypothetical protein [Chitinophagales bacterium]
TTHGNFSTAFGTGLQTNSYGTFAIGRYNEGIGNDLITWDESLTSIDEPVFVVGIGTLSTPKNAMTITKAGTVGVGTSSPTALFEIEFNDPNGPYDPNRAMYVESGGNAAFGIGGSGSVSAYQDMFIHGQLDMWPSHEYSATYKIELPNIATLEDGVGNAYNWHTYSDQRVKKEVKEIPYGLDAVMQLRPVHYHHHSTDFKDGFVLRDDYREEIGFIAQETYNIIDEVVYKPEDESKSLWSMNYGKLTPVLVKAIQEQQAIIESLQKQLSEKDTEMKSLRSDVDKLFKMVIDNN